MAKKPQMVFLEGDGSFQIEVTGESRYGKNLEKIAGSCKDSEVEVTKTAYIVPEPKNMYDPNAMRVDIDQLPVGYLPKPAAAQVAPALRRLQAVAIQAQAKITAFEGANNYSVWLDGDLGELLQATSQPSRPRWKLW
jgi:hypothetical protein